MERHHPLCKSLALQIDQYHLLMSANPQIVHCYAQYEFILAGLPEREPGRDCRKPVARPMYQLHFSSLQCWVHLLELGTVARVSTRKRGMKSFRLN